MRHIEKTQEPPEFVSWKRSGERLGNPDWTPSYDKLQNPEKSALKCSLMAEQHGVCCYCERIITDDDSHIEHVDPQTSASGQNRTVDYDNLLCSCLRERTPEKPFTCGHARGDWYCSDYISPLEADCASHFGYRDDGSLVPASADDRRAAETIAHLRLQDPILKAMRKKALDGIFSADDGLDASRLRELARAYATPDEHGIYDPGFPSMFEYLFLRN